MKTSVCERPSILLTRNVADYLLMMLQCTWLSKSSQQDHSLAVCRQPRCARTLQPPIVKRIRYLENRLSSGLETWP